jgi:hypothetical protein
LHHPVKFFFREDKELSAQMFEATAEEDDGDDEEEDEVGMEEVSFPFVAILLGNLHPSYIISQES